MNSKITSRAGLNLVREQARKDVELRDGAKALQLIVHMGTCGIASGARDILMAFADQLEKAGVSNVTLRQSGCAGLCDREPMATLTDAHGQTFVYGKLNRSRVREIVRRHLVGGTPIPEYLATT